MCDEDDGRRAKWDQPEIDDFGDSDGQRQAKGCSPYHNSCLPMNSCRPHAVCYPSGSWACRPHRPCYPQIGFISIYPYCRPYGFNYGYGCYPRK